MSRRIKQTFCLILVLLMLVASVSAFAEKMQDRMSSNAPSGAMGQPPEGMGEPPQGSPGDERPQGDESVNSGAQNATNTDGLIAVTGSAYTLNGVEAEVTEEDGRLVIDGLDLASDDYSDTVLSATGNADVTLQNAHLVLGAAETVEADATPGEATYIDSGTLHIKDSDITVNGAGRYTIAAENDATMIVNDSAIRAGGDAGANGNTSAITEPFSNAGLLISGTSRANFSVGATDTYYYNSLCVAEGWAALSTDSATGDGLDFTGYNTEAIALHGGYGLYADTNCRDTLYGSTLVSAEVGAILSNNGAITMTDTDSADEAALAELTGDTVSKNQRSTVIAGRNDFQLHSPDMMGEGSNDYSASLTLAHTDLITDASINEGGLSYTAAQDGETYVVAAAEDYAKKYGAAIGAYVDHAAGAAILVKSTSAEIALDDVTIDSFSGVALLSTLNSDSMSRYLKQDAGKGVNVQITDSEITGDFVHEDYQRDMRITLDASTLDGIIAWTDAEAFNALWADYSDDEDACWVSLDASAYVTDSHETALALTNGSIWRVTGESRLTALTMDDTSSIEGTVLLDGEEVAPEANTTLTGNITVLPLE